MAESNPTKTGIYTNRSPSRRGPKPIPIDPRDVEALAEACVSKTHLAEELGISLDALRDRLLNDQEFAEAHNAGIRKLRRHVASTLLHHAEKNAIAAITLANQPYILGFTNPNQRIEGKIEHVHTLSPAEGFWSGRLSNRGQLSLSQNETVSQLPSQVSQPDSQVIEVKADE